MPYITYYIQPREVQVSFDDLLQGVNSNCFETSSKDTRDTRTIYREITPQRLINKVDVNELIRKLMGFNSHFKKFIDAEDKSVFYHSFPIPKKTGGLRRIDAPNDDLMEAQRTLAYLLKTSFFANYHTSAFAYIPNRSPIDALRRHQANNSRWFLKTDFHDFFGSITMDFAIKMLSLIYPFNLVLGKEEGREQLQKALSICFLNGGLPQGTPISPMLTNLLMIPIDHSIAKFARDHQPHLIYTRFADDIQLSSQFDFENYAIQRIMSHARIVESLKYVKNPDENGYVPYPIFKISVDNVPVIYRDKQEAATASLKRFKENHPSSVVTMETIQITKDSAPKFRNILNAMIEEDKHHTKVLCGLLEILQKAGAPFTFSNKKIRYGSSAGRNWNLGLMLNQDNNITVGYKRKKHLKTALFALGTDYKNGRTWDSKDIQALAGEISYCHSIEPDTIDSYIAHYTSKCQIDIRRLLNKGNI